MSEWKKVKIDFATIKLGDYIEPIKTTVADTGDKNPTVYGVTNKDGISQTGKPASKDISNYIVLEKDCFAFNPYRINVGSIGINDENLKGCVSPAYVVFKTKNGLLPKFLYFYLKSDYGIHLINWYGNRGGVRNTLRYSDLCKIDIPDIRHLNQEKLLKTFSSASTRIDELNKEIEKQKSYAKQLRQNILQEAIEGKLTADWRKQHPVQKGNPDYDAEALFDKIQTEKQKKGKKQKLLPAITEAEKPFAIPSGWKWVRLGEICFNIEGGKSILCKEIVPNKNEIGIVKTGVCSFGYFKEDECKTCLSPKDWHDEYAVHKGDFLIGRANTLELVGSCVIVDKIERKLMLSDKILRINFDEMICSDFILCAMKSKYVREQIERSATGSSPTMKNISQESIKNYSLPLPPLAEQKEIVAWVEQHLQTITQLETQIATRETTTKQLMQSILKEAFEK